MYSTWLAMSLIRLPKVPEPEPGGESRTRIRKPSVFSSMEVPSRPRSANSLRPMSSSCCLRSLPVILFRLGPAGWLVTTPSWRSAGNSANRVSHPGRPAGGHRAELAGAAGLLGGQPLLIWPADVVCPAELLGQPDAAGRDVDLA